MLNRYIVSQWANAASDTMILVRNSVTEEKIGTVAMGNGTDVDKVAAAVKIRLLRFIKTTNADRM